MCITLQILMEEKMNGMFVNFLFEKFSLAYRKKDNTVRSVYKVFAILIWINNTLCQ